MSNGIDIFKIVDETKKGLQPTPKVGGTSTKKPKVGGATLNAGTPDLLGETVKLGEDIYKQGEDVVKTFSDEGIVSGVLKSVNTTLTVPAEILMHFTGVSPILKELEKNKDTKKVADIVNFLPEQINAEVDKRFELPEQQIEKIQNPKIKEQIKSKINSTKDVLKTLSQYAVFGELGKLSTAFDKFKIPEKTIIPESLLKEKPKEVTGLTEQIKKIEPEAPEKISINEIKLPLQEIETALKQNVSERIGETVPPVGMSTKYVGGVPKTKLPYTEADYKFSIPEIEQRYTVSHGLTKPTLWQKATEVLTNLKNRATREYEYLPKTEEFAIARNELLKLGKQKDVQADRVINDLRGITLDLNKTQLGLFERKILLDDLANEMNQGRDLPFGFNRETLPNEISKINNVINTDPLVQSVIAKRNTLMEAVRQEYIKAMNDVGFNVEGRFDNTNYFRHQVLEYANTKGVYGTGKKLRTPTNRGFLKERKGSSYDINTNYLEAEYEVMSQMLYDVQIAKTLKNVDRYYNIARDLKKQGIDKSPEGYVEWQPREGNQFYLANTIPERIATNVLNGAMELIGKEDISKSLAMGRERPSYIIPEQIAKTLDNLTKEKSKSMLFNVDRKLLTLWKQWQLLSPRRVFKYNIRNITGDLDHVLTGNPSSISKIPQAFKELYDNYIGSKPATSELQEWINRGGKQQTLQAVEIADISKINHFKNLIDRPQWYQNLPKKTFLKYWETVRLGTDMRESMLRYATYLDYLSQLKKGKLKNYGASLRKEINTLPDIRDKAYRLSNDLLGAYDEVSLMGQGLRQYLFPFWSWKEANARIYKRLVQNAVEDGKTMTLIGKKIGIKSPLLAYKLGKLAVKGTAFWSLLQVYNNLFFPQEEEELNSDVRKRPHIILGRNDKGNIKAFTQIGALGDLLSWAGLDEFPYQVDDILKGERTIKEIAMDFIKAPLNVFIQGSSPYIKIPFELITNRKLFPDFSKATTIRDKGQYIASSVGLNNEYNILMKLPNKEYVKTMEDFFIYSYDPKQNAMFDVLDEKRRFLEKKGQIGESVIGFISDKSNALYNYKQALRFDDKELADAFLKQYMELGGTRQGMNQSLKTFDPLFGLDYTEKKEFAESLDPEMKRKLAKAIMYYKNIIDTSKELKQDKIETKTIYPFNNSLYLPVQP